MKKVMVTESNLPDFEEYANEIKDIWKSKWLTNMGVKHEQLTIQLEKYLDVEYVTLFSNGHLALEAALEILNLQGEVITTPFTFASTTHAIVRKGLTPVFCDVKEDCTIDETKIERLITDKTSAIVPVHVYGRICNVEAIEKIALKYSLKVIYDAAHAFGVKYKGTGIGNFGDMSMLSFHATKVFHTIEGGAVVYNNVVFKQPLCNAKNFGILNAEQVVSTSGNAKMNEFQAAMGICNLRHIDDLIQKRKNIFETYIKRLGFVKGIKLFEIQKNVQSNYAYFPILILEEYGHSRDELKEYLETRQIFTRKYFYPLTNDFDCYKDKYSSYDTPVAKFMASNILTLPMYASLEIEAVELICHYVKEFGEK